MYVYDIETLATNENSVILQMGCTYIKDSQHRSYESLLEDSIFIKLDSRYQIEKLGRKVDRSTLDWWKRQAPFIRDLSFKPSPNDLDPVSAIQKLRAFVHERTGTAKTICYTRGFMDVIATEHLAASVEQRIPWAYNDFRDVRTAIDLLYPGSKDGYVTVDPDKCYNFDISKVYKHQPHHDCAFDAAMLLYGKIE